MHDLKLSFLPPFFVLRKCEYILGIELPIDYSAFAELKLFDKKLFKGGL